MRGELVHGTRTGYTHYRCRCDECREAARAYAAGYRAERLGRGVHRLLKGRWVRRTR